MNNDKFEATVRQVGGKLQDVVGGATGDTKLQMEGKLDEVAGFAQQVLGDAKQTVASAAGEVKATVGDMADRVTTTASDLGHSAYDKTADLAQKAGGKLRDNPIVVTIAVGLVGVAIGFLLGRPTNDWAIQAGRARLSYRDR